MEVDDNSESEPGSSESDSEGSSFVQVLSDSESDEGIDLTMLVRTWKSWSDVYILHSCLLLAGYGSWQNVEGFTSVLLSFWPYDSVSGPFLCCL